MSEFFTFSYTFMSDFTVFFRTFMSEFERKSPRLAATPSQLDKQWSDS